MLKHHTQFKEYDTWFLCDTKLFTDRKLLLGKCPQCHKDVAALTETRIEDGRVFTQYAIGYKKVEALCSKVKHHIKFTSQELVIQKGTPVGLCYGVNKDIKSRKKENKGEIIGFTQSRCDNYNQKEIVKTVLYKD